MRTSPPTAPRPDRHPGAADDHRRQPDQGLRRGAADAHGAYTGFVNGDTSASLTTPPTLTHHRHGRQPRRGQPLRHHRQRRRRSRLHDQLRRRHADRHPGAADDHRRRPDQGLRRGAADAHRVSYTGFVNGDTAASLTTPPTLTHHGHGRQPRRRQPLRHHRQRRGRRRLHDQLRRRHADRHPGAADDHRRQPDQGLRRGAADPDRELRRLRQRRHRGQPDHPADARDHRHGRQPRRGQPLRHHRQRRGRHRLHDQLRRRHADRHPGGADDHRRQPDQGLRRGAADAHGELHRLRQRRHRRPA